MPVVIYVGITQFLVFSHLTANLKLSAESLSFFPSFDWDSWQTVAQVVGTIGNLFLHLYFFRQRKNREYNITFKTLFINSSGFTHSGGIHTEWSPTLGPRQSCLCSSSKFKANTQWATIQMWQQDGGKAAPVGLSSLFINERMQRNMQMSREWLFICLYESLKVA